MLANQGKESANFQLFVSLTFGYKKRYKKSLLILNFILFITHFFGGNSPLKTRHWVMVTLAASQNSLKRKHQAKERYLSKELQEKASKVTTQVQGNQGHPDVAGDAKDAIKKLLPFFYSKRLTYLYPTPRVKKRNRYTHDHILASMAFSITIHVSPKSEI